LEDSNPRTTPTANHERVHDHVNVHVDVHVLVDVVGFVRSKLRPAQQAAAIQSASKLSKLAHSKTAPDHI
jgi:hypothetical protein